MSSTAVQNVVSNEHDSPVAARTSSALRRGHSSTRLDGTRSSLYSSDEFESIQATGAVVAKTLQAAIEACQSGVSTERINDIAAGVIADEGAESAFLNYTGSISEHGFPAEICVCVNDQLVHGIPGSQRITDGDVVSIDCGALLDGWYADAAVTIGVGSVHADAVRMIDTADGILNAAIGVMRPGVRWSSVAGLMQDMADQAGFSVVTQYVGHGIGRSLHEPPSVPAYGFSTNSHIKDFTLEAGMVLAVEPMLTLGSARTRICDDGWTVVTCDGSPSVHVEHTIAITSDGPRVMTLCEQGVCA